MNSSSTFMPEWVRQEAVMLAWPHADTDWAPWLEAISRDYAALTMAIAREATPLILCRDDAHEADIRRVLAGAGATEAVVPRFVQVPYNDTWCRDYGPLALGQAGKVQRLLDFEFNGWGSKYAANLDNAVNRALGDYWRCPLQAVAFELEGGSVETDGAGTLLTTRHCLLDSARNRDRTPADIEALLRETLGVERILWISEGALSGDDTDSHIDNLVRFCSPDTLAYASCSDRDDNHYEALARMAEQVHALTRPDGGRYRCVGVDIPAAMHDAGGQRLPGSYVNFLILNDSVLVPTFGCPEDARALNALASCFPGYHMIPVPGANLVRQFGGPHCATMQLPAGTLASLRT